MRKYAHNVKKYAHKMRKCNNKMLKMRYSIKKIIKNTLCLYGLLLLCYTHIDGACCVVYYKA